MDRRNEVAYIGNHLSALCPIPFGAYNTEGELVENFWMNGEVLPDSFKQIIVNAIRKLDERRVTMVKLRDLPVALWVYNSNDGGYYVWGPVQYERFTQQEEKLYEDLILKRYPDYKICTEHYGKALAVISCFAYAIDHRRFSFEDMVQYEERMIHGEEVNKQMLNYMIRQEEDSFTNHTYTDEQYPQELLRNGDVEGMRRYVHLYRLQYPKAILADSLKNEEYMAVAAIGIIARTAIEAGVTSAESFRLSDVFLQRIAQCRDTKSILKEREEALVAFTKLVERCNRQSEKNSYVEDCKKDIATRILQKISLDDIAKDLGVRATYLARLFSEAEGVSVGRYIRQEKMKLAVDMLKHSSRSIAEISDYLCFSSQSYFGKIFKQEIGMPPELYRKKFRTPEF